MPEEPGREYHHHHREYGFIPAGALIGLGIGLLLNYAATGILVGLGAGFLATAFVPHPETEAGKSSLARIRFGLLFVGIFLILIGIGLVYTPPISWSYIIAIFLILVGILVLVQGYLQH